MHRRITVLGSTGSIGKNTLSLIGENKENFSVIALVAHRNAALLAEQAKQHQASMAVLADESELPQLRQLLEGTGIACAAGQQAVLEAARMPCDIAVAGITGFAGLAPTLAAIEQGAVVALANKECLVAAGDVVAHAVRKHGTFLLPVDSEHNGLFQIWCESHRAQLARVTLTASGGPFRTWSKNQLMAATPEQAVKHPNWPMGAKISVDSATLMNKGLEIIEAGLLFGLSSAQLDVLVHPESTIHAFASYRDGSTLAQLACPDMRVPISQALSWPHRIPYASPQLDLATLGSLNFEHVDNDRFPCLGLARQAMEAGGGATCVLNAANEVAVDAFLKGRTGFMDIPSLVSSCLDGVESTSPDTIEAACELDAQARGWVEQLLQKQRIVA
ncbi:1-deoxy-D-xylulose-5-phosphate reductoisomerase [bacterium]|nr:1-deoxy-D-xylulose-5-phosphate reductoisomerase [bacterium]